MGGADGRQRGGPANGGEQKRGRPGEAPVDDGAKCGRMEGGVGEAPVDGRGEGHQRATGREGQRAEDADGRQRGGPANGGERKRGRPGEAMEGDRARFGQTTGRGSGV